MLPHGADAAERPVHKGCLAINRVALHRAEEAPLRIPDVSLREVEGVERQPERLVAGQLFFDAIPEPHSFGSAEKSGHACLRR